MDCLAAKMTAGKKSSLYKFWLYVKFLKIALPVSLRNNRDYKLAGCFHLEMVSHFCCLSSFCSTPSSFFMTFSMFQSENSGYGQDDRHPLKFFSLFMWQQIKSQE